MTEASRSAPPEFTSSHGGPLVSVVIATFNRWPLVRETIESILAQSFSDFEIVVVDDGSTDRTADYLEATYPTVRVIRQPNTERGAAINHGIRAARGTYVAFLGDDDVYEPWHLEQFAEGWRQSPTTAFFASRAWLWDPLSNRRCLLQSFDPATLRRDALVSTVIVIQTMIVARTVLLEVDGLPEDRSVIGCEDWVVLLKLVNRYCVMRLPRPSVRIRQHPGRSMNNLRAISDSREVATSMILGDNLLGYDLDPESVNLLVAGTHRLSAAHLYGAGEMREARARMRQVRQTLGWVTGLRWTGRMWLQTWLGQVGSVGARRLKQRLTWRSLPGTSSNRWR